MPSGPPELHNKWGDDHNAAKYLQDRGYVLTRDWEWTPPEHITIETMDPECYEALCYLVWEWDYGGLKQ